MKRVVLTLVLATFTGCTCAQLPEALFLCEEDGSCAQPGYVCGTDMVCRRPTPPVDAGCGDVTSSAANCGACGVTCASGSCTGGRCVCNGDTQCPTGSRCAPSGVCTPSSNACVSVQCPPTQVCRPGTGTCAPVNCSDGCLPGEVCDSTTQTCRVLACRLPVACDGGTCPGPARADGTPCDDAQACTSSDQCVAGECVGTSYSCPGSTACRDNVVCDGDGGCAGVPKTDGTACDDGVACTFGDSCTGGTCSGTTYSCPTSSACVSGIQCLGDGGCAGAPANEAGACDDGVACTSNDRCASGTCTGTAYTCPTPTACQQAVACAGDGGCVITDKMNGDSCDDGVGCTNNDTCNAGVCAGTPGTSYRDQDGDGRGDSNVSATGCPAPMGYVGVGGDCNDNDPAVFQAVMNLVADLDGDGRGAGSANVQCVGAQVTVSGRTYYQDAAGNPAWLVASQSLGADCDDTVASLFQSLTNLVTDVDKDGYSTGTPATQCVGASAPVGGRTYYVGASGSATWLASGESLGSDCNDTNGTVYQSVVSLVTDMDQDGFGIGTAATQCVGATSTVGGRTYYGGVTGLATWLSSTAALGSDCNDTNSAITGPTTWYLDGDGDGRGGTTTQQACAAPANHVATGGDCNDASSNVYQTVASLVTDVDGDGYSVSAASSQCVGASITLSGRTYYRDLSDAPTRLVSSQSLGADCDDTSATLYQSVASLVTDGDRDGYSTGTAATQCVGTTSLVGGRTYYLAAGGAFLWLGSAQSLGTDCDDANVTLLRTVANLVTDADQDGWTVGTAAAVCVGTTTAVSGRTYYQASGGAFSWLASTASLGADCNDANASVLGPSSWYLDGDTDGVGAGTAQVACTAPANHVAMTGDCDDTNLNVYRTVASLSTDVDQDGYSVGAAGSQCVGTTTAVGGRTYYRSATGAFSWLSGTPLGTDCDDASASVQGPTTWYVNADGDSRGGATTQVACTQPGGYIATPGDCNDSNGNVFQTVSVYDDTDQDGWTEGALAAQCVGATSTVNTRTYYRAAGGAYTWITASLGVDCLDTNDALFQTANNLVADDDRDGYPPDNTQVSGQCVGATIMVGGRTYYPASAAPNDYWMLRSDCINRSGSNCTAPFDCYDLNASALPGQLTSFGANRGDGSFDYDCSGSVTTAQTGTWCSATTSADTFSDGTCASSLGTQTICTSTAAVSAPSACGGYLVGGGTFYNPGTCTATTLRGATQVLCR